ncbi:MAG TPA: hypothetical protein VEB20_06395 [Azospirillaceae bacterium]|nr:hypothetical protein [Azospirillaceae bacterium]
MFYPFALLPAVAVPALMMTAPLIWGPAYWLMPAVPPQAPARKG